MWSKGRTQEKPSIPSFVVHFSRPFYREQFARRLRIGSFPGSPIHLRLPPLTPLRKPETLPVITYPVRHMCTRLEGPRSKLPSKPCRTLRRNLPPCLAQLS